MIKINVQEGEALAFARQHIFGSYVDGTARPGDSISLSAAYSPEYYQAVLLLAGIPEELAVQAITEIANSPVDTVISFPMTSDTGTDFTVNVERRSVDPENPNSRAYTLLGFIQK